jgi:cytochrome c553
MSSPTIGGTVKTRMLVLILLVPVASASAQRSTSGVRPIATVRQLHEIMITPASDAVFRASGDTSPNEKGWVEARNQALVLGEAGNLLMLGSRARDNMGWMRMSRALVDAAATAASAAEKKDADALAGAGDIITAACEACHQPYRDRGRQMGIGNGK